MVSGLSSDTNMAEIAVPPQIRLMAKGKILTGLGARIATAREGKGLSQTALGKAFGITRSSVSQWESETTEPTSENLRAIAMRTGVDYDWLATGRGSRDMSSEDVAASLPGPALKKTVKLKGYVGAGSEAHFYKIADEDFEEVPAMGNATDKTVAVQIRGKSWGPAMDTWLVFYDDVRSPVDPSMHGKPCIVGLSDDRILLKIVYPQSNGLFRLLSNSDEPPIMDAEVEWAALVTGMAPRT